MPEGVERSRLFLTLTWDDEATDLDVVLQGLWEGEQWGYAQSQAPGPPPEFLISSSAFGPGDPLWLWVAAYDGPPTDYQFDLVLR